MHNYLILAVEDELSRAVGQKIAEGAGWSIERVLSKNGKGYLQSNFQNFCHAAKHTAVFLLVDLNSSYTCAPSLLREWTKGIPLPRLFFFRVAVREVESWLLADHEAMKILLGNKGKENLPPQPDILKNPKAELLTLLKKVRHHVREGVVRLDNGRIFQGVAYNPTLVKWIDEHWHPERAAARSESLNRLLVRLRYFDETAAKMEDYLCPK